MNTRPRYSVAEIQQLIFLRHTGRSWVEVAEILERDLASVRRKAIRLRDAGDWKLVSGAVANGAPDVGSGRPRKHHATRNISFRVSSDVAQALQEVAHAADVEVFLAVAGGGVDGAGAGHTGRARHHR